mmetsp:Transcript_11920/g.28057  ORF Transcript_11920/g.28057 Transcript_11920/m.28057 type:complete len:282 (+) Transcript_11920:36-881(+)
MHLPLSVLGRTHGTLGLRFSVVRHRGCVGWFLFIHLQRRVRDGIRKRQRRVGDHLVPIHAVAQQAVDGAHVVLPTFPRQTTQILLLALHNGGGSEDQLAPIGLGAETSEFIEESEAAYEMLRTSRCRRRHLSSADGGWLDAGRCCLGGGSFSLHCLLVVQGTVFCGYIVGGASDSGPLAQLHPVLCQVVCPRQAVCEQCRQKRLFLLGTPLAALYGSCSYGSLLWFLGRGNVKAFHESFETYLEVFRVEARELGAVRVQGRSQPGVQHRGGLVKTVHNRAL